MHHEAGARSGRSSRGRRPSPLGALLLALLLVAGLAPPGIAVPAAAPGTAPYIVQLSAPPAAAYTGGIRGYAATSPRVTGRRLDLRSAAVRSYRAFLHSEGQRVLAAAGAGPGAMLEQYGLTFPGFAAELTPGQAEQLARTPGVARVWKDVLRMPLQATPPGATPRAPASPLAGEGADLLGLPDGLWSRLGGPDRAGEGVVIGVLDTGIYADHPSFADQPETDGRTNYVGPPYAPPANWNGVCQAGEAFPASACNNKLIGARYFVRGFGRENVHQGEFLSPMDSNGHGTHTAATAAGNYGVKPVVAGADPGVPMVSGIAPRAWIAAYKVCWSGKENPDDPNADTDGCPGVDSIAAVEAAVADGVDVINYSVGSPTPSPIDPLGLAFLYAAGAGIFVATAAGNSGPSPSSIGSPAGDPWVTSVAASTLARTFRGGATLVDLGGTADPVPLGEAAVTGALPPTPLVEARTIPRPGTPPEDAELCKPHTLDASAAAGKVVVCRRGELPLVEKGISVKDAGGAGMVIYNTPEPDDVVAVLHWLPTAHVTAAAGEAIKTYLTTAAQPAVSIEAGQAPATPDVLAPFSSRGPQSAVPSIAKPDVTAPGVDVLAATTPRPAHPLLRPGETFRVLSGTSMASPHVAGAAALLTQLHPTLTPAEVKSALMTTAAPTVVREDGTTPATPLDAGSGRIDPNRAASPGLVLDIPPEDYSRYIEGIDPTVAREELEPLAPSDLNLPSISFAGFLGVAQTTRTFTSVDATATTWQARAEGLPGATIELSPTLFTLAPGQTQSLFVRIARTDAAFDTYTAGAVVLEDRTSGRRLRVPVTVEPIRVAASPLVEVGTQEPAGSQPVAFAAGYEGSLTVQGYGLAAPTITRAEGVAQGPRGRAWEPGPGVRTYDVTAEAGTQLLAFATTNIEPATGTDLDLFVFHDATGDGYELTDLVAESAGPTGEEAAVVVLPGPGAYRVAIVGFAVPADGARYDFATWTVRDPTPDNPAEQPGLVASGDPVTVTPTGQGTYALEWSGVAENVVHLGLVTYSEDPAAEPFAATLVLVRKGSGPGGGAWNSAARAVPPAPVGRGGILPDPRTN